MAKNFFVKQIQEGSLIFNNPFGVEIFGDLEDLYKLSYEYRVYENGNLIYKSEIIKEKTFYFNPKEYKTYKLSVNIYENNKRISYIYSPILDFIEDFVSIKETELIKDGENLIVKIDSNLDLPKEYYAYYLKKDGVPIEKIFYIKEKQYIFKISGPGKYSVRVFARLIKNNGKEDKVILDTNTIYEN